MPETLGLTQDEPLPLHIAHPTVRRCPGCREPAAVVMRDWAQGSFLGLGASGSSGQLDWVCQACGRSFRTRPRWIRLILGMVFLPFILCGPIGGAISFLDGFDLVSLLIAVVLGLGGAVAMLVWAWPFFVLMRANTVSDAPYPEVRYTLTQPARRCSCGGVATCFHVTETRSRGVRTGTEFEYRCHACGSEFTIEDGLGMGLSFLFGGVFGIGAAIALPYAWGDWCLFSGAVGLCLLGWGAVAMAVVRFLNRFRHPTIDAEEAHRDGGISAHRGG